MTTNISFSNNRKKRSLSCCPSLDSLRAFKSLLLLAARSLRLATWKPALGMRQASISQHLMALRKAELVHRSAKVAYLLFSWRVPKWFRSLSKAAQMVGITQEISSSRYAATTPSCPCPQCNQASILTYLPEFAFARKIVKGEFIRWKMQPDQSCSRNHQRSPNACRFLTAT